MAIEIKKTEYVDGDITIRTELIVEITFDKDSAAQVLIIGNSTNLIMEQNSRLIEERKRLEKDGYEIIDLDGKRNPFKAIKHHI